MKTLSFIIPAYNSEKTLAKCLNSILNQDYCDYDIILIDDASIDKTLEIMESYKTNFDCIKILIHKKNKGPGEARNSGIKNSDSDYIYFLDSDDYLIENSITDLIVNAKESQADLIVFNYNQINTEGTLIKTTNFKKQLYHNSQKFLINVLQNGSFGSGLACNKLFKKSILTKYNVQFPKKVYYEDMPFVFHYITVSNSVLIYEKVVYNYIQTVGSISNLIRSKNISDNQIIINQIRKRLIKQKIFKNIKNEWNCFYMRRNCDYMISKIKNTIKENNLSNQLLHEHLLSLNQKTIKNNIEKLNADYLVYLGDFYKGNTPFDKRNKVSKKLIQSENLPLVSYLMPVWNREDYLAEAIQSVLIQTYQNIELLIIDDASTDQTSQIIQEFAKRDNRIRTFKNSSNLGNTKSRNILLKESKGDFIAFIDSDDYIHPQKTEIQIEFLRKNPKYGAVGSYTFHFSKFNKTILSVPKKYEDIFIECFNKIPVIGCTVVIRKSILDINNILFDENCEVAADYYLCTQLVKVTRIANIPKPLYYYRIHDQSISSTKKNIQIQTSEMIRHKMLQAIIGRDVIETDVKIFRRFVNQPSKFNGNIKLLIDLISDIQHNIDNKFTNFQFVKYKMESKLMLVARRNRKILRRNKILKNKIFPILINPFNKLLVRIILLW